MKAFLLLASLSFASAIMLVPHDGNETRPSIHDALIPENSTDTSKHFVNHLNFTNDVNTKHRPYLAIVETRKLFENEDNDENYSDDDDNDDDNDTDDSNDGEESIPNGRSLLKVQARHSIAAHRKAAPATPKAAPATPKAAPATPKAAPVVAPKAAPATPKAAPATPKAAPVVAPKAAPATPKAAPATPKAAPVVAPKSSSKSKSKSKSKASKKSTTIKADIKISAPTPTLVVNKYSSVDSKLSAKTKELAKKFESAFTAWVVTTEGQEAIKYCQSLGIANKQGIYNGCIEDMRVTKSESIAKESAIAAEEFLSKEVANPSKRFCVASGDPHVTNYDGILFHIQEPGIYTVARTPDAVFEIQEKMRKNGNNKPGVPSCMTGAVIHYKQMNIEVDVANFGKIRVNGQEMDLPEDFTLTFGGLQIRYGKQVIEWKGAKMQPAGLKITTPNGFSVMVSGGYCGVLETNVPTAFFGKMQGICGNADGVKNAADYMDHNGATMNVNYGAKNWEMGGYNGPDSPLSKWQLSWKPHGTECYFAKDCEGGVQTRKVIVVATPAPTPVPTPVPVVVTAVKSTPASVVVVGSPTIASSSSSSSSKSSSSSTSSSTSSFTSSSSSHHHEVCKPEVFPNTSPETITKQVAEISADTKSKMNDLYVKFKSMMDDLKKKHHDQVEADKKILTDANLKASDSYDKYTKIFDSSKQIFQQINMLNVTLNHHHSVVAQESEYLARLEKFKPKFLYSLDNIKAHVSGIKNDIHATIVEGADKKGLLSILDDIRSSTDKSATLLAKAFLDHYDKYNKQLKVDTNQYDDELKRMGFLSVTYNTSVKESSTLWKEYSDILGIAKELKKNYKGSNADEKSFDELMSRIASAFKTESSKSDAKLSTPNTQCAADVLKAHLDHKRV
jgi:hypothetical protein